MKLIDGRTYRTKHGEEHMIYRNPNQSAGICAYWLSGKNDGTPPTAWYENGKYWLSGDSEYDLVEAVGADADPWTTVGTLLALKPGKGWSDKVEGARAVVTEMPITVDRDKSATLDEFVSVRWIDRDKFGGHDQNNGIFRRSAFFIVPPEPEPEIDYKDDVTPEAVQEMRARAADQISSQEWTKIDGVAYESEPGVIMVGEQTDESWWTPAKDGVGVTMEVVPVMEKTINVKVALLETSQVIEYVAKNTYTKGPFFCIQTTDNRVHKHPICTIWRITEDYGDSGR